MPINAENLLDYGFSNLVDSSLLAALAQLVEQRTENPCVPGSIPGGGKGLKILVSLVRFLEAARLYSV